MTNILKTKKESIIELMLQREITKLWINKCIAETPDEIKNFVVEKDNETEEYKTRKAGNDLYKQYLKQLDQMAEANRGDLFAYQNIDEAYKTVNEQL